MDKQLSRVANVTDKSYVPPAKINDKRDWLHMNSTLPAHMHNQANRSSVTTHHEKTLRAVKTHEADYKTFASSLNDKKLFRVNPETG